MHFLFIVLYALAAVLTLFACSQHKRRLYCCVKPLLMPLLCVTYCFFAQTPVWIVALGMLLGGLGDLLLLFQPKIPQFPLGVICFALEHVCYTLGMAVCYGSLGLTWGRVVLNAVLYGLFLGLLFTRLRYVLPQGVLLLGAAYVLTLCAMSACALLYLLRWPDMASGAMFAGTVLFVVSDTILGAEFASDKHGESFWVMWTYCAAQTLLALGFILY